MIVFDLLPASCVIALAMVLCAILNRRGEFHTCMYERADDWNEIYPDKIIIRCKVCGDIKREACGD